MTFDRNTYNATSAAMVKAANSIDKATANAQADFDAWAKASAAAIAANSLTLDDVKAQLIADFIASLPATQATLATQEKDSDGSLNPMRVTQIGHCGPYNADKGERVGNTIKSRYYALQKVAKAEQLSRVAGGEALNTVARDVKPVQKQGKKGGTPRATKSIPTLSESVAAIRHYVSEAKADSGKAMELATNGELAAMIADLAALEAQVTASVGQPMVNAQKIKQAA